ncbi:uncharacterized protein MELLADRAFT_111316 [Melampsora larici-populina 98AG31]|uniref:Uncharacterized protein n=1 Tax=Melampsora larici-populina (strain 98AG31 / pathotype 3-4-7) TaxID=747676 RepID=F4S2R5_MELLP|nr:uncharacterized protein MELLADRAFT_111316 [Melampsora larici-populina 98AG31]EGG01044.1 hypothetical protein MELLADRAFT_111316 [Melampsora larici-populina 98AG31]
MSLEMEDPRLDYACAKFNKGVFSPGISTFNQDREQAESLVSTNAVVEIIKDLKDYDTVSRPVNKVQDGNDVKVIYSMKCPPLRREKSVVFRDTPDGNIEVVKVTLI